MMEFSAVQLKCVAKCAVLLILFINVSLELNEVNPHDYNYLINPPNLYGSNRSQEVKLLIMVFSAPYKFDERMAVRNSWGLTANQLDIKRLFLLGKPEDDELQMKIYDEAKKYGDIIQEDFKDVYRNLTLKSIMMVKWAMYYCPKAKFLLKIDDDCFLNPYNLFKVLDKIKDVDKPLITGQILRSFLPIRDINSKSYISVEEYPSNIYPDFVNGPSYLYTRATFSFLYNVSLHVKFIPLEDVYMNGLCAEKAKIPLVDDHGFTYSGELTLCNVNTFSVTYHQIDPHFQFPMLWWAIHEQRIDYCSESDQVAMVNRFMKSSDLHR